MGGVFRYPSGGLPPGRVGSVRARRGPLVLLRTLKNKLNWGRDRRMNDTNIPDGSDEYTSRFRLGRYRIGRTYGAIEHVR